MTDDDWGDDLETPMPTTKTHIPRYVWNCGIGCLVFVVLSGIALWYFGAKFIDSFMDQDVQWAALEEGADVQRPDSGWELMRIPFVHWVEDIDACWSVAVTEPASAAGFLILGTEPASQSVRRGVMQPDRSIEKYEFNVETNGRYEIERDTITVAGRELKVLRFQGTPSVERDPDWYPTPDLKDGAEGSWDDPDSGEAGESGGSGGSTKVRIRSGKELARGAGITVDLSDEEGGVVLLLQLTKYTDTSPWEQGELESVLTPFVSGIGR